MCSSCYSVFSFLWIPLPSNLMHFLCREPLNLKTGEREISFSQKHRGNNKHNICNHLSGEMVIYLSKNVLTFFAIGGEGKGTHSPESKYVAIRITASANSLLQMELPTTLSLMFWGKASSVFVCKEGKSIFPKEQAGHNHNYRVFNNFRGDEIARQSSWPLLELLPGQRNPKKYHALQWCIAKLSLIWELIQFEISLCGDKSWRRFPAMQRGCKDS